MRFVESTNIPKALCTASLRCGWLLAIDCISKTRIVYNAKHFNTSGLQIALLLAYLCYRAVLVDTMWVLPHKNATFDHTCLYSLALRALQSILDTDCMR